MKKTIFILICICLLTGCNKEKLILDCKTTIKDSGENIRIKFYRDDTATRTIKVTKDLLTSEEDVQKISESLKQNYCNNQIKDDYYCEVLQDGKKVILKEKGESSVLMGETKKLTIDKYKSNLEKKSFICEKKK